MLPRNEMSDGARILSGRGMQQEQTRFERLYDGAFADDRA
jgi:hypothetical protein